MQEAILATDTTCGCGRAAMLIQDVENGQAERAFSREMEARRYKVQRLPVSLVAMEMHKNCGRHPVFRNVE